MPQEKLNKEDYIQMSIDSGVKPLELRYTAINDCYGKLPKAYRTQILVNSVMMGQLKGLSFLEKIKGTEEEVELFKWSFNEAIQNIKSFWNAGRHPKFISVKCPVSLTEKTGLYDIVKTIIENNQFENPECLCLEFSNELLNNPTEQKKMSILDMKILKVKTCVSGCGSEQFPLVNLLKIPVDMVVISSNMVKFIGNRDYPTVVASFISFLQSMKVQYYAEGIKNDDQCSTLSRADCFGYIADDAYTGSAEKARPVMSLDEAMKQREDED